MVVGVAVVSVGVVDVADVVSVVTRSCGKNVKMANRLIKGSGVICTY